MADSGLRGSIQLEWFNVSYRGAGPWLLALLLLGLGGGGYWFYSLKVAPSAEAAEAIERARTRLREAQSLTDGGGLAEIVEGARVTLAEACGNFEASQWGQSRIAAIRSENLSLKAIGMVRGGDGSERPVRFYRLEGDVRVKNAGEFAWQSASTTMMLQIGDQVKTSSSASAQVIYFDGTITTVQPGSLLEIRDLYEDPVTQVRWVREKLSFGEVRASTPKRNVRGSYHEVATDSATARSEEAGEFRVAFDRQTRTAEFDVFDGRVQVSGRMERAALAGGERIRSAPDGKLMNKQMLPGAPRLLSPADQRVFIAEDPTLAKIGLSWESVPGATGYRLVISDRVLFSEPLYDRQREGTTAEVEGVAPGAYYWRVAAFGQNAVLGTYSNPRRFRVSSQQIRDRADAEPPALEITDFVAIGSMVIVNGRTEPGAELWIDNEKIDVDTSGTFYAVVRLRREGLNELQFLAQDAAGNEVALARSAFVESF